MDTSLRTEIPPFEPRRREAILRRDARGGLSAATDTTPEYKQKLRNKRRKLRAMWRRRVRRWGVEELNCKPHRRAVLRAIKAAKKAAKRPGHQGF